jgi:hypothetical protein
MGVTDIFSPGLCSTLKRKGLYVAVRALAIYFNTTAKTHHIAANGLLILGNAGAGKTSLANGIVQMLHTDLRSHACTSQSSDASSRLLIFGRRASGRLQQACNQACIDPQVALPVLV